MVCTAFPRAPLVSVPEDLPAQYRGADEDWSGTSAFTFVRYITPPDLAPDGVTVVSPGVPRDLTGCTARGLLYERTLFERFPLGSPIQVPVQLDGDITDAVNGEFELTLAQAIVATKLTAQDRFDPRSRYILRALVTDPSGRENWVGTVPVFVL